MDNRVCLICTLPIKVPRLGVEACRACASFFKRTVVADRKFTCRQGDRKCVIRTSDKFLCRSCRYDKCLELGMSYMLPPRTRQNKKKEKPSQESSAVDDEVPSTSSASTTSPVWKESLLDRMQDAYKASHDRRLAQEQEYALEHKLKPFIAKPELELFTGDFSSFFELFRVILKDSTFLLQSVFDDFDIIPIEHRVVLFKHFVARFSIAESIHHTSKNFKNTTNYMSSLITAVNTSENEHWMPPEEKLENPDAFRVLMKSYMDDYTKALGPIMKMEVLTDREFLALVVLCYCDVDASVDLPDEIVQSLLQTRKKLFEELQDYYRKDLKMDDFSKRLGNIMTIAHAAGEAGLVMNEEMRMYATFFDLYADDRLFVEFFE